MAATMKDIARRTGLGLATISSYFNGGNVREKNRIKIEAAIQELHYEVNEVARGLKTNATKTIGVVIPEQLSKIGFDNLQFARACNPKLTIVAQPTQGIAGEVAGIMLKRLEGAASEETEPITEKLGAEIIMGKSVCVLDEKEKL